MARKLKNTLMWVGQYVIFEVLMAVITTYFWVVMPGLQP
jgi:hypothetical protein